MWRDPRQMGPAPSQHVVILPQRITTFLSRCVKDTWVKDHIARWVSIAFGGRSPHSRDPLRAALVDPNGWGRSR